MRYTSLLIIEIIVLKTELPTAQSTGVVRATRKVEWADNGSSMDVQG